MPSARRAARYRAVDPRPTSSSRRRRSTRPRSCRSSRSHCCRRASRRRRARLRASRCRHEPPPPRAVARNRSLPTDTSKEHRHEPARHTRSTSNCITHVRRDEPVDHVRRARARGRRPSAQPASCTPRSARSPNACRHAQLPCLPAIVWRADTRRPSDGYYKVAHPRAQTAEARLAAWEREHARVLREVAQFPTKLA